MLSHTGLHSGRQKVRQPPGAELLLCLQVAHCTQEARQGGDIYIIPCCMHEGFLDVATGKAVLLVSKGRAEARQLCRKPMGAAAALI